ARAMDRGRRRCRTRRTAAAQVRCHARRCQGAARLAQGTARVVERARRHPERVMKPTPRLADWILKRALPLGKRGESIIGDLREEFHQSAKPASWYWAQTLRLTLRYAASRSPQQPLTYPRSNSMWLDLAGDCRTALRMLHRNPGTSSL